jgi:hypothetical protein
VKSKEEWITAAEAARLLAPVFNSGYEAKMTICKRAHAGLIGARAERFMINDEVSNNVEIRKEFWWAEGGAGLTQNWTTGDFETWFGKSSVSQRRLRAFSVSFLLADIEKLIPAGFVPAKSATKKAQTGTNVFIGHGRSHLWRHLKDFLEDTLHLSIDEFDQVSTAGIQTVERLSQMLNDAAIAFLVMTAEDEQKDGKQRENVVHETGLFQGRHGFKRAIVVLEEGCEKFSNIAGLGHIPFPKGNIMAAFEDIRRVLEREGLLRKG